MISSLENLYTLFGRMDEEGWDIHSMLNWGFFFVDADKLNLQAVYKELKEKDYVMESIDLSTDGKWTLHVSKPDILTPEKLHKRNIAFNKLAEFCSNLGVPIFGCRGDRN